MPGAGAEPSPPHLLSQTCHLDSCIRMPGEGDDVCGSVAWALTPKGISLEPLSAAKLTLAPTGHPVLREMLCEDHPPPRKARMQVKPPLSQSKGSVDTAGHTMSHVILSHESMPARPSQAQDSSRLCSLRSSPEGRAFICSAKTYQGSSMRQALFYQWEL